MPLLSLRSRTRIAALLAAALLTVCTPARALSSPPPPPRPTFTFVADPEPSVYGSNFDLVFTITPAASTDPNATGTVTFSVDGSAVGIATLSGGSARFTVVVPQNPGTLPAPGYIVGPHSISAAYSGDPNYGSVTLNGTHQVIGIDTTTTITNIPNPIFYGQTIDGVGQVAGPTSGGTLTFFIDGVNVCALTLNGAQQSCPPSVGVGYHAGNHTINSTYSGDDEYAPSASPIYPVVIQPDVTTASPLLASPNPSTYLQPVTLTEQITAPYATPVGPVIFYDGPNPIGTVSLDATGTAALTTSTLAIGSHNITTQYAGNADFLPATSPITVQVVTPASTTTTVSSSLNPSTLGQSITFTATTVTTTGLFIPGGALTFLDGNTPLATTTLDATGHAAFTTSTLAVGTHPITAVYAGSTTALTSTSTPLQQVVNAVVVPPSGYSLQVTPPSFSVGIGAGISLAIKITPYGGFSQTVQLACANLPAEVTCNLDTPLVPVGGGTYHVTITPAAPHDCGSNVPYFIASTKASTPLRLTWLALTLTTLFLVRRRRALRALTLALALLAIPAISALEGCGGHCTDFGVKPGNYTFAITSTSTGTPVIAYSQTMQMNAHL